MRTFTKSDIFNIEGDLYFSCAMVSTCSPVFDHCDDNHEVENELRAAKVLTARNQTDTESCEMVVLFSNEKSAVNFINRLNTYLEKNRK